MGNTNNFLDLFNTRETATIIWLLISLGLAISQKKIRKSLFELGKAFLHKKILCVIIAAIMYTCLIVFIFSKIGIWQTSLIKDTTFWFIGTAFALLLNVNNATQDNFFKKILKDNLKLILVLEFIVNFYTFNLLIELILIPFLFLIIVMSAYAERKKEYIQVKKIFDFILSAFGIFLITYALSRTIIDYQRIASSENLRGFILPPLLTFAYIPFLYLFALTMEYENLFMRIDIFIKNNKALTKFAKRKIIRLCHINLRKLNSFSRKSTQELIKISSEENVEKLIKRFRKG